MRKILKVLFLISMVLTIAGCGKDNSPKPLNTKFIGTYIDDSHKDIKDIVTLDLSGKNLYITYEQIDDGTIKGKSILEDKIVLEIENALFTFDKENNKYLLNEETIKNVIGHREKVTNIYTNEKKSQKYTSFKDFKNQTQSDDVMIEIKVNDTRKEVLLDFYANGAYSNFITFVEGYKQ